MLTSHLRPSITSSTSCTTNRRHSRNVASSLNHGFRVPKTPFRRYQLPFRRGRRLMEDNLSRSFKLSCLSYPHPIYLLDSSGGRCMGGRVDSNLFPGCAVRLTRTTFGDSLLLAPSIMKHLSLAPFYNLSPTLKLLHVYFGFLTCSQIFNFVRSSPLFEDLVLSSLDLTPGNDETPHEPHAIGLSPPPVLTGFLGFNVMEGMGNIAHRLWICRMVFTSEGSHSRRSTRGIFDG